MGSTKYEEAKQEKVTLPREQALKDISFGQIAYEAYCAVSNGKSLISGADLPKWEAQKPEIQSAWEAAARAVRSIPEVKSIKFPNTSPSGTVL